MNDEIWLVFGLYAFALAVVLIVMFYLIRGAILSALTEDRRRQAASPMKVRPGEFFERPPQS